VIATAPLGEAADDQLPAAEPPSASAVPDAMPDSAAAALGPAPEPAMTSAHSIEQVAPPAETGGGTTVLSLDEISYSMDNAPLLRAPGSPPPLVTLPLPPRRPAEFGG
jgi:hypothetical protein